MGKIIILISLFLIINFALGAIVECGETPCSWQDLSNSIQRLLRTIVLISFWLAFLLTSIGAFLTMFHGPSPGLYQKGVNMIKIALIGYILILSAGIIFDLILEFFAPKFAMAFSPTTYYDPLKNALTSGLKCEGDTAMKKLFNCIFQALGVLKNLAVILLVLAIIVSAAYLITTPLFGFENIKKAKDVLIWSIIGLIIVLTADLIKDQIIKILK